MDQNPKCPQMICLKSCSPWAPWQERGNLPAWSVVNSNSYQLPECVVSGRQLCSAVKIKIVFFSQCQHTYGTYSLMDSYKVSPTCFLIGPLGFLPSCSGIRTYVCSFVCFDFSTLVFATFSPNLVILMERLQKKEKESGVLLFIKCPHSVLFWVKDLLMTGMYSLLILHHTQFGT